MAKLPNEDSDPDPPNEGDSGRGGQIEFDLLVIEHPEISVVALPQRLTEEACWRTPLVVTVPFSVSGKTRQSDALCQRLSDALKGGGLSWEILRSWPTLTVVVSRCGHDCIKAFHRALSTLLLGAPTKLVLMQASATKYEDQVPQPYGGGS